MTLDQVHWLAGQAPNSQQSSAQEQQPPSGRRVDLREILDAASGVGEAIRDGGVYACFEGPRFETPAEIRLARLAGADVAGMTGVPEVVLAVEAGLRYAAISLVVNPASGVGDADEPITMDEINAVLAASSATVLEILDDLVHTRATFPEEPDA